MKSFAPVTSTPIKIFKICIKKDNVININQVKLKTDRKLKKYKDNRQRI